MIEVTWFDDDQTIVCYEFPQKWSWNDLDDATQRGHVLYTSVFHQVSIIFDMRISETSQSMLKKMGLALSNTKPLNCGLTIIVTENPKIAMLAKFGKELWQSEWKFLCAKDIATALNLIAEDKKST